MCVDKITIKSNIKNYNVVFESEDNFLKELSNLENSIFIVDENVYNLHKGGCLDVLPKERLIILKISEDKKTIQTVCELYEMIMKFAPRKNLNLISIGGGITQDVTGFVASTLYRGVNWIFVPTTLLAQVDSCIGAKTSLNFNHYKNLVGTFYPPSEIHIYPEFLRTLSRGDFYSGVGEMAKLHIMNGENDTKAFIEDLPLIDKCDFDVLLKRTRNCLNIKKSYIENDEFDTGRRNLLNYGHCFGHAIESSTDFGISHGQAVVLGMILANKYAKQIGILSAENEKFVREKVLEPILVAQIPEIDVEKTIKAMGQDKKNLGKGLALVMLKDNYELVKITDLTEKNAGVILKSYMSSNCQNPCRTDVFGGGGLLEYIKLFLFSGVRYA
ncbi:3-dehydroquinate synthase [bacterium]|nr:3-dehydroquinate synthase [bacterium]